MLKKMDRKQAAKVDKKFYLEFDQDSGCWHVFGDYSGFAYTSDSNKADGLIALTRIEAGFQY